MTGHVTNSQVNHSETHSRTVFGFWIYLMTDCVLFASLFAAYAVLHNNTYGGPSGRELFNLPYALTETLILLTSSFTCGLAGLAAGRNRKNKVIAWFGVTFLLGISFLAMEATEFTHMVQQGNSWERSGFLSSYFTLVGTHGLHITTGLLWMIVLLVPVCRRGLTPVRLKRLMCLRLFWHFLDIVWIFIFTIVYLMGVG
jgi:cytochrome o ubiquinol oxidase subunit III